MICRKSSRACKKPPGQEFNIFHHISVYHQGQIFLYTQTGLMTPGNCRLLENHHREQRETYESQMEGLALKVDHLQNENSKLQNLFQEKSNINEDIRQEMSRLSCENSVCWCNLYFVFRHEDGWNAKLCCVFFLVVFLFVATTRSSQSWKCSFQSCRDKSRSLRLLSRSKTAS